jgi:capsular exopolysaccharide synthesis family protein
MAAFSAGKEHATLADFLQILRQRRALVFAIAALVILTTAAVTAFLPKWYLSAATVRVEKPEGSVQLYQQVQGRAGYDPFYLQDQFKIMQSPKILDAVIANLGLNERLGRMLGAEAPLPTEVTYRYLLAKMLRIENVRNTSLIEIRVFAREPRLAAEIANEIARVYSEDRVAFATSEQREGLDQLRRELEVQERNVSAQRDAVERIRNDLNLAGVDLSARYSDMEIETLRQMQNSLIALRVDAIGRKTRWERFRAIPPEDRVNLVNSELIQDANIQNLLQAYFVADQNVARLRARLGEAHPDLVAAVGNVQVIRAQLDGQLRGYENALEIAYKESEARVVELENQLAQAKVDQILSARDRLRPFEEAVQRLEDETRIATTLRLTLRQREVDFQVPKRTTEVLGEAQPALRPAKPNWTLNLILAVFFGVAMGVGLAVLIDYFDTSFRSVVDVETRLRLPVLGVLPVLPDDAATGTEIDPALAEPFRVLHTNLKLTAGEAFPRVVALLSAGPGEGKSTTLHRLAVAMAEAGERVLLIDGDVRRPVQHRLLGVSRAPGLGEVMTGRAEAAATIKTTSVNGLDFLPSGGVTGFTFGLLHADRLRALLREWRERYDRVLIDSPPIIGVSDAAVLAGLVDAAVLVIQHRRNPRSMVLRARQVLDGLKVPLAGAVLNRVPPRSGEDYDYYTANYAYYRSEKPGRSAPTRARPVAEEKLRLDE